MTDYYQTPGLSRTKITAILDDMQGHIQPAELGRRSVAARGFVVLAAGWLLAQAHHGVFLGSWADKASLPGNACWLLILYCQLRLALFWLSAGWQGLRVAPDMLLQLLSVLTLELASRALGGVLGSAQFGQMMYFVQPIIVLLGFAALHRHQLQRA